MTRLTLRAVPLAVLVLLLAQNTSARGTAAPLSDPISQHDPLSQADPHLIQAPDPNVRRAEIGTKDAPVDGLDGKPHAGPFVDSTGAVQSKDDGKSSSTRDTKMSGDSVMNDENRHEPRQGTTGTEGGMTEKDRDRRIHESSTGERMAKVPSPPKAISTLADRDVAAGAQGGPSDKVSDATTDKGAPAKAQAVSHKKTEESSQKPSEADSPKVGHETGQIFDDDEKDRTSTFSADIISDGHDSEGAQDIIPWDSLVGSFSSIAATEIGDKTFIVAALMAMRHSRIQVFSAAFSALFVMTILSGVAGHAMGAIISKKWSALVAALLFLVFGAKSLREGFEMSPNQGVSDEIREVEAELEEKEVDMARHANGHKRTSSISPYALEAGRARTSRSRSRLAAPQRSPSTSRSPSPSRATIKGAVSGIRNLLSLLLSPAWVETFSMTFVGELGDRSQIATVAMAAGQEYYWVMVGASVGHFVCTGVAVLGGSVLAGRVSLRKVTLVGGGIFIFFGLFTLIEAFRYWT